MSIIPILLLVARLLAFHQVGFDEPRPGVDVIRYEFRLTLSNHSDVLDGVADVTVKFTEGPRDFFLDLASLRPDDVGMIVSSVSTNDLPLRFEHREDRLWIRAADDVADSVATFRVAYRGVPADGLIISQNRFGDRTFFADNWPNRARHWIPTVDHPADKAFVDFVVTAPDSYQVIANGRLVEESDSFMGLRTTHWSSTHVLPTKIMAIGVARFAVKYLGEVDGVPLETWVYPQSREEGFQDFEGATRALEYFTDVLGPFPWAKLANVQSTTRYGGMENASAIFYNESSVTGTGRLESTIAHEIAHQWFGDSASEEDFHDVWLSEGFATYLTQLYFEHYYGGQRLAERMAADRLKIIEYAKANPASSVVDTTITDPNRVLNENSYEKGGWTLHMLRGLLGDEQFWTTLTRYYDRYRFGNATTADFRQTAEAVFGQDLDWFFDQWIYRPGVPDLLIETRYDEGTQKLILDVRQRQALPYRLTLDLTFETEDGPVSRTVEISEAEESIQVSLPQRPIEMHADPKVRLLAQVEVR